jgi:putative NADH-flavin reductase
MATIAIIGASRGIGLETVRRGLALGHTVKAMARSDKPDGLAGETLTWLQGDATSPDDLEHLLVGADAVIQTLGVANPFSCQPVTLFSTSTRHLVELMQRVGPKRLIVVTGFGAGDSRGKGSLLYEKLFFPLILSRIYKDKDVQEDIVKQSGLDWTIVRPGLLTKGRRTGHVKAIAEPDRWRSGVISRADVADFLITQIDDRKFLHQTPVLIG